MSDNVMQYCQVCKRSTQHIRPSVSHILHLFLTIITAGIWLIVWLIAFFNAKSQSQCTQCGRQEGIFGSGRGGTAQAKPDEDARVPCPDCAELIQRAAKVCKHCGKRLD